MNGSSEVQIRNWGVRDVALWLQEVSGSWLVARYVVRLCTVQFNVRIALCYCITDRVGVEVSVME